MALRTQVLAAPAAAPLCFTKPAPLDLCVYRGDSGRLIVTVVDDLGQPVDITTATWDCDIRASVDAPLITSLDVQLIDANTIAVIMSPESSAMLPATGGVWDLEMTLGGEVTTLLAGKVTVTKDVSRDDP